MRRGHDRRRHHFGKSSYYGLSPTACYVLTYSLPLKKLLLTGRDTHTARRLSVADIAEAVVSARFDLDRKTKSAAELVQAFDDWSRVACGWAADELSRRPEATGMVPALVTMAGGPNARRRQGAAEALGYLESPEALPVLVRALTHEDRWRPSGAAQIPAQK